MTTDFHRVRDRAALMKRQWERTGSAMDWAVAQDLELLADLLQTIDRALTADGFGRLTQALALHEQLSGLLGYSTPEDERVVSDVSVD